MKTLDIRVAFSAVDRLTRPTENARRMMGQLGDSIQRTQGAIKNLERYARSFDRAREAANKAGNGIVRAQRQLSALQQIQRAGTVLSDKQKKLMNDLSLKLERLNEVRAREVQRMRELGGELRRHGIALSGSDNTIQQAIRRTQQYNDQLERERQALARVTQARQQYSRAQETAGKLKTVGLTAVGTAAAGGYAAGRFLQPAVSFGKEMSRVQALTRIDKNSPQFKALREQAIKLGSETQFTAGDAASGQAFLAMAGFTPQAIQAALPGVLDLAMAAGMDLGQTADISSNILTQFGLSADQMDRVGDTLAATFTRTNTDLRSLGETMKYTGPVAASLGLSLEQAAAMTGVLGSVGIRGSDAGTALRASLSRLVDPPKAAAMALKELGVETQDAYGNMRRMENILNELYQATRKYGNAAQVSFFRAIAGQESYVSLMNLVTAAGENNLPRLTQEIELATGELNHTARVMADNLDGDLKSLNSAWEGLRIRVADLVDGPLRSVTQSFTRVIAKVTALAQAHPELTKQLLIAGGVLLAAVAAMGALSLATGVLMGPLAKLRLGFALLTGTSGLGRALPLLTQLRGVLGGPLGGIGGWRVLFVGITSGAGRFAALLGVVAGRLRGVQAGLGALRGGLLAAFTSPGGALISLGRGIGILALRLSGLPALWGMVSGAVGALGGALGFLLSPVGLVVATLVGAAVLIWRHWDQLKAVVGGFLSGLWQGLKVHCLTEQLQTHRHAVGIGQATTGKGACLAQLGADLIGHVPVRDNLPEGVQRFDVAGQIGVCIRSGLCQNRVADFLGQYRGCRTPEVVRHREVVANHIIPDAQCKRQVATVHGPHHECGYHLILLSAVGFQRAVYPACKTRQHFTLERGLCRFCLDALYALLCQAQTVKDLLMSRAGHDILVFCCRSCP